MVRRVIRLERVTEKARAENIGVGLFVFYVGLVGGPSVAHLRAAKFDRSSSLAELSTVSGLDRRRPQGALD